MTGDTTTPANVIINSAVCITASYIHTQWHVSGFKFVASSYGVYSLGVGSYIDINDLCDFGACTHYHIYAIYSGRISVNHAYNISGSAGNHMISLYGGQIRAAGGTHTLLADITVTAFASAQYLSILHILSSYTLGAFTVTGKKYESTYNAFLQGASKCQGTVGGTTANGGLAIG